MSHASPPSRPCGLFAMLLYLYVTVLATGVGVVLAVILAMIFIPIVVAVRHMGGMLAGIEYILPSLLTGATIGFGIGMSQQYMLRCYGTPMPWWFLWTAASIGLSAFIAWQGATALVPWDNDWVHSRNRDLAASAIQWYWIIFGSVFGTSVGLLQSVQLPTSLMQRIGWLTSNTVAGIVAGAVSGLTEYGLDALTAGPIFIIAYTVVTLAAFAVLKPSAS
jgi:hypothetical protein